MSELWSPLCSRCGRRGAETSDGLCYGCGKPPAPAVPGDLLTRLRAYGCKDPGCVEYRCRLVREAAAEIDRLRATACATPDPRKCVLLWEADHQRRAIEEAGLTAEEFPFGCDAVEHVALALADARAENPRLREALRPFAEFAGTLGFPDGWRLVVEEPPRRVSYGPTVGDCRRAAALLGRAPGPRPTDPARTNTGE